MTDNKKVTDIQQYLKKTFLLANSTEIFLLKTQKKIILSFAVAYHRSLNKTIINCLLSTIWSMYHIIIDILTY